MFRRNVTAARGGLMGVNQATAQQAPVAVNSQFKPFMPNGIVSSEKMGDRLRTGVEDFESGAVLFVAVRRDANTPSEFDRRMRKLGHYHTAGDESQPFIFSNLELVYLYARDVDPATGHPRRSHEDAIAEMYKLVRVFGISDTDHSCQNDHTRDASGGPSVITRVNGDKTIRNTGFMDIGPADDVVWFSPCDPKMDKLQSNRDRYPWTTKDHQPDGVPPPMTEPWRAILLPLTQVVYEADPSCVYRAVGKAMYKSHANGSLTLNAGTRPALPPDILQMRFEGKILDYKGHRVPNPATYAIDGLSEYMTNVQTAALSGRGTPSEIAVARIFEHDASTVKLYADDVRRRLTELFDAHEAKNDQSAAVAEAILRAVDVDGALTQAERKDAVDEILKTRAFTSMMAMVISTVPPANRPVAPQRRTHTDGRVARTGPLSDGVVLSAPPAASPMESEELKTSSDDEGFFDNAGDE